MRVKAWVLQPLLAVEQPMELIRTRNSVRNGIRGNLMNDVEVCGLNRAKQPIELLSDLKLNSNRPTQHPQEKWQPDLKAAHDETHYLGLGLFMMMQ